MSTKTLLLCLQIDIDGDDLIVHVTEPRGLMQPAHKILHPDGDITIGDGAMVRFLAPNFSQGGVDYSLYVVSFDVQGQPTPWTPYIDRREHGRVSPWFGPFKRPPSAAAVTHELAFLVTAVATSPIYAPRADNEPPPRVRARLKRPKIITVPQLGDE